MLNFILLQEANPQGQWSSWIMILAIIVIFYFFMIRPQQKKQKEIKKFRESIAPGDRIVTAGGIYGKVKKVKETTFVIEVSNNVDITIDRGSVYPSAEEAQKDAESAEKK